MVFSNGIFPYPPNPVDQDSQNLNIMFIAVIAGAGVLFPSLLCCLCKCFKEYYDDKQRGLMNRRIQTQRFSSHPYNVFDESSSRYPRSHLDSPTLPPEKKEVKEIKDKKTDQVSPQNPIEEKDPYAEYNLGRQYEGSTEEGSAQEALKWFRKGAEKQVTDEHTLTAVTLSEFKVGLYYEEGEGVTKDEKEAFGWYTKAAERNKRFLDSFF